MVSNWNIIHVVGWWRYEVFHRDLGSSKLGRTIPSKFRLFQKRLKFLKKSIIKTRQFFKKLKIIKLYTVQKNSKSFPIMNSQEDHKNSLIKIKNYETQCKTEKFLKNAGLEKFRP